VAADPVELPLRTADVAGWLTARYGPHSAVRVGRRVPLVGGLGSALVERVELLVTLEDRRRRRVALVVKRTDEPEVQALRLLAELAEEGIPELISVGGDEAGQWIVIPFYDGEEVGLMGEPPPSAYEVIARVHAHFQASAADLSASFERVDSAFCARSLGDFAQRAVIESRAQIGAHPVLDRASALASRFACDAEISDEFAVVPDEVVAEGDTLVALDDYSWKHKCSACRGEDGPRVHRCRRQACDVPAARRHRQGLELS